MLQSPSFSTIHAWKCSYQTAVSDAGSHEWQCLHSGCWLRYFFTPSTVSDTHVASNRQLLLKTNDFQSIHAASVSNRCRFDCSWMQCCQQNHVRSVYARPMVIPMSWTPLCGRLEVNLCRATSVSVVSSTLDYNNRKTLIIIITNSNYYYYYYKNNNNNDQFIHSHFTEVKIKQVSAQCWAVVWVPQG